MKPKYRFSVFAKFDGDAQWSKYETDDLPAEEAAQLMAERLGSYALLIEKIVRRLAAAGKAQVMSASPQGVYPTRTVVQDNGGSRLTANMPARASLPPRYFMFCCECLEVNRSVLLGRQK